MPRVAVAAASQIAADAGRFVAERGGNAVDAAIAASLVSMTTDPGIVALGAGSYVTISVPGEPVVVIDGYVEMPGRSATPERRRAVGAEVHMEYGGGTTTYVGHATVATPGSIAAFGRAAERFGRADWSLLFEPAKAWAARGFPLAGAAAEYLSYSAIPIFGWHPESRAALVDTEGVPRGAGDVIRCDGLVGSLTALASSGPSEFYTGRLGRAMADDVQANGGLLAADDLAAYEPVDRPALELPVGEWTLSTNPGPAIGGAAVIAALALVGTRSGWAAGDVAAFAYALRAVLTYRTEHLDGVDDRGAAVDQLVELARLGDVERIGASPSTVHVSAVDDDGVACSITTSAGYGSGVVVPGTGIWLNNSLGEVDLFSSPVHEVEPGTRLPSNMAPTVARHADGTVLAVGSPGASRISSAVAQVAYQHLCAGAPVDAAVDRARIHVERRDGRLTLAHEPGVDVAAVDGLELRPFDRPSMYFGGVQVARWNPSDGLSAVADQRRAGGVAVSD